MSGSSLSLAAVAESDTYRDIGRCIPSNSKGAEGAHDGLMMIVASGPKRLPQGSKEAGRP